MTAAADLSAQAQGLLSPDPRVRDETERALLADPADAIPHLVAAVEHGAGAPRGVVGRLALVLGALRAREGLLPLLERATAEGTSDDDRAQVVRALAEIVDGRDAFDDRVTARLEELRDAPSSSVRGYLADVLGALGDERSRARVEALTEDKDPFVRGRAERVLARLADARTDAGGLEDFGTLVSRANEAGGRLKPWLDDLDDSRRAVRESAAAHLVAAGPEAVPFLVEKLNQPRVRARADAARALGQLQATEAAGALLIAATAPAATAEERELRPVALRSLANCLTGTEEGLAEALLPLADDPDRFVRAGALLCLGRLADRKGMRKVVEALTDADPFVVESASIALSEGVREEDIELVSTLLSAFDLRPRKGLHALREAILIALSRIQIADPALRVRVRHRVRQEVAGPTAALRKAAIALLERLHDENDAPVLPLTDAVLERLADDHPEVRVVAAGFLAAHLPPGFSGAARSFAAALLRKERTLSLLCLEGLARLGTPEARELLKRASSEEDRVVAERAAELCELVAGEVEEWRFVARPREVTRPPARGVSQAPRGTPGKERPRVRAVVADEEDPMGDGKHGDDAKDDAAKKDPTGEGDVVDAHFTDTDEGAALEPAMSMPSGEMPSPEEDEGPTLPPPSTGAPRPDDGRDEGPAR